MDRLADTFRAELGRFTPHDDLAGFVERWPASVGDAIARNAWPARLARDGTLIVNTTDSVWAFELTQRAAEIAARVEATGIRFAPGPLAGPAAGAVTAAVSDTLKPAAPSLEDLRAAAEIAAGVDDEKLRETVQRAVSLSLARGRSDRLV